MALTGKVTIAKESSVNVQRRICDNLKTHFGSWIVSLQEFNQIFFDVSKV